MSTLCFLLSLFAFVQCACSVAISADKRTRTSIFPDLYEASVLELQVGLEQGQFSSVDLVKASVYQAYFARIEEVNLKGPELRAVLELNQLAPTQAEALDRERRLKGARSPSTLVSEGLNTTAGSFALLKSVVPDDAEVVKRLRAAGAIILGAVSHQAGLLVVAKQRTRIILERIQCGSSSGSAIAASIGLVAVAIGTETDGSITCPASNNNIVGIKPTVGLTSRTGVIPVSKHQDTVGPLARSVADAAAVLSVIAGPDPNDNFTLAQPVPAPDFSRALDANALQGARIGVPRRVFLNDSISGNDPFVNQAFEEAIRTIEGLGATVVDPADLPSADEIPVSKNESLVLAVDFKVQINAYFNALLKNPTGVRNLADLIAFDNADAVLEEPAGFMDQSMFTISESTNGFNVTYFQASAHDRELGGSRGIDAALKAYNLDALILPAPASGFTTVPPGPLTVYPAPGVPIGLAFIGTAFSDFDLISYAYAYEQKTRTRLARKAYVAAIPKTQLEDVVGH
ncbi:amidase signature enzyme [Fomitiporia mediterranea MF3/22]|uniref:amidase signature enzyme n=1 Tax=Fomitiporia mediterranea (strain MF3/22) TaxID=694068 RepID=UPI000440846F|nr:amidase signature enzyme [Fomitiporia mediterranea MF3/22]EJD02000.1 amidase signature enzyme [Fomitiporia mediterranea MF3/22]